MTSDSPYLARHHGIRLDAAGDAFTVISADMGPLIFTLDDVAPDFFVLANGKAGEVFQKFINYGIRAAFVIPVDHQLGARITELAREHATHSQLRITSSVAAAHEWLSTMAKKS